MSRPTSPPQRGAANLALARAREQAIAAFQRGDRAAAGRLCGAILAAHPNEFEVLYLAGVIAVQGGKAGHAAEFFARAATIQPGRADVHFNHGVALGELARYAEALESYARALAIEPAHADAHYNSGTALGALGRYAEALQSYERVIALQPDAAQAHHNLAVTLAQLGRHEDALRRYDRAIAIRPDYAGIYQNRGVTLSALGRYDEALESYERAVVLDPGFADAHNHRAIALLDLDRASEALASCDRALALDPHHADAWYHRGNALRELSDYRGAIASYERAIAVYPEHARAHWNLADCLLLLGDFTRGWQEYEWRWKLPLRRPRRDLIQPLWLGSPAIDGRTILLHSELGLGDTLQFCRYAPEIARQGAKVLLEVQRPLVSLLASLEGVEQVFASGDHLPSFDFQCPMLSLPLAFKARAQGLPTAIPYLRSDPARVGAWRHRLGSARALRVGLVWSGSRGLRGDKRSMALSEMLPLLVKTDCEWMSLQKEVPQADYELLSSRDDVRHLGDDLRDFADTAAVLELIDLLVTVDTSVAHVAGAMGKPVWILLPSIPHDWRWLLNRDDSPWYPTARLFRQSVPGDWDGVIRCVIEALEAPRRGDA